MLPNADTRAQVVRYLIAGLGLTLFYSAVYWGLAVPLGVPALISNAAAFLLTLMIGYVVHSRWSFRGHGRRENPVESSFRFLVVNLAGFALNSFWVWLIVERLSGPVSLPILPIVFVTPWISFLLLRKWTFR